MISHPGSPLTRILPSGPLSPIPKEEEFKLLQCLTGGQSPKLGLCPSLV